MHMAWLITDIVLAAVFFAAILAIMLAAIRWQSREQRLASERRQALGLAAAEAGAEPWPAQEELDAALAEFQRAYSAERRDRPTLVER